MPATNVAPISKHFAVCLTQRATRHSSLPVGNQTVTRSPGKSWAECRKPRPSPERSVRRTANSLADPVLCASVALTSISVLARTENRTYFRRSSNVGGCAAPGQALLQRAWHVDFTNEPSQAAVQIVLSVSFQHRKNSGSRPLRSPWSITLNAADAERARR